MCVCVSHLCLAGCWPRRVRWSQAVPSSWRSASPPWRWCHGCCVHCLRTDTGLTCLLTVGTSPFIALYLHGSHLAVIVYPSLTEGNNERLANVCLRERRRQKEIDRQNVCVTALGSDVRSAQQSRKVGNRQETTTLHIWQQGSHGKKFQP